MAAFILAASLHRFSFFFDLFSIDRLVKLVELAREQRVLTIGFYFFYAVGVMALPITMFPIIGGVLLPFGAAFLLNLVAATVGAWFSFLLSRRLGRHAIENFFKGKIRGIDKLTASQGFKTVFFVRFIGVPPFIVANYALGFSKVKNSDFITGTFFGILPWMGLVTFAADSLWKAVQLGGEEGLMKALFQAVGPLMILSTTTLVIVGVGYLIRKRKNKHHPVQHHTRHLPPPPPAPTHSNL